MPKVVSEIYAGSQFQRSSENKGTLTDSQTRVYRILLNNPGEVVNPQNVCGIKIGDPHPVNTNIYCVSWDVKFEGDSRTVMVATFNYQSTPASNDDDKNKNPPDQRPANWSTSTSIIEVPAYSWIEVGQNDAPVGASSPPINPVGDMYDGVTTYDAVVTISIEQYFQTDPTQFCAYVGYVNSEEITVGNLTCPPGSVLFRGVTSRPTVESHGDTIYKGWTTTFEFAYRRNFVAKLWDGNATYDAEIGWDIAVPQTGFNIINKEAALGGGIHEIGSLALEHDSDGKIKNWPGDPDLVPGTADRKVRGMVLVHAYADGGASQLPCAQPIPLNADGTPRASSATPKVIVRRYRTNGTVNFTNTFGLRLDPI